MRLLVTGGLGFIGSNFVRHVLNQYPSYSVLSLDKQTYAGNPENLNDFKKDPRYSWVKGDISDQKTALECMKKCQAAVHFAAESHVDRSILGSDDFLQTNVLGTHRLLEAARQCKIEKFVHVSTDEVYGSKTEGESKEEDTLYPNSPYSSSKAASDHLARAYWVTFGVPTVVTRCSNNFGPYQYPEKAVSLLITNALENRPYPLYGDGKNVRDWLFVEDHVRALDLVLHGGKAGEIYNIGGTKSCPNNELVRAVLGLMEKPLSLIAPVPDRPGHDRRYALNCEKIKSDLGWRPAHSFEEALKRTIEWYRDNRPWWQKIKKKKKYTNYYKKQYKTLVKK